MHATQPPKPPYKGLRFYTSDDAEIFAARDGDARRCVGLLSGTASVVMLHGRTGCGKSSFLRAALKPQLETGETGLWLAGTEGTFIVVRSGLTPLREVAGAVFDAVHKLKQSPDVDHFGDLDAVLGQHTSPEDRKSFVDACSGSVEMMVQILAALGDAAPGTPLLVIDQAEEVFTLQDKERGAAGDSTHADSHEEAESARIDYMNLLRAVAEKPAGVKVLISLRTEYKGLFEDELRRTMSAKAGAGLKGFHLNELSAEGIVAAIKSPTREEMGYNFSYEPGLAAEIADRLLNPEAVPMGGVLPALQVVCSRLYEQTRRSKSQGGEAWTIQRTDLERLGKLDDQLAVYLREQLEEMFLHLSPRPSGPAREPGPGVGRSDRTPVIDPAPEAVDIDRTKDIDTWYRLLERLVRVQGDGRAVTRQLAEEDLQKIANDLQCRLRDRGALDYLAEVGILRCDGKSGTRRWTLGHDSLGLAIQKWTVTYKESVVPTMRMDFNSPRSAARLTRKELFPDDPRLDVAPPPTFHISVRPDLLWDHQLPLFADSRRLSERLGISFFRDSTLELSPSPKSPRMLVSADRAAFPPPADRSLWTDIAVCDLFQGNGLVGPLRADLEPLRAVDGEDDEAVAVKLRRQLAAILDYLVRVNALVLLYDESSKRLLQLAAYLAGKGTDHVSTLRYEKEPDAAMSEKEKLFERLASFENDSSVFMVGTAYGRALASHRGYVTYFDAQDLTRFMEILDRVATVRDADSRTGSEEPAMGRSKLFRMYQDIFSHTVWQINVPAADWRRIEHYPLVLRLASLCYFTSDYMRSFPDDFVRYLYDWHATAVAQSDRVSRETIREILQRCFQFLSFDENPRLLFDPDNKFEFSPRDADDRAGLMRRAVSRKIPSTVSAIHAELTALRKRTVDLFGELCWQLEQLEPYGRDARGNELLSLAEKVRGSAWSNFRIYNYYDSARLMDQALRLVSKVVAETTERVWRADEGPAPAAETAL